MVRPPVSVVVAGSGDAAAFAACLDALRPQLGVRDEVVVVLDEQDQVFRAVVSRRRWVKKTLPVAAHDGAGPPRLAALCARGAAVAQHEVVVFCDGDVVLGPNALPAVAAAFTDPEVVAAGPRCHRSAGPQSAALSDRDVRSVSSFNAAARRWRLAHRGERRSVPSLGPVVFAVRLDAWSCAVAERRTDPWSVLADRGHVVVVGDALAAHHVDARCILRAALPPDPDQPLLSACLIVKDESEVLAHCLESVRGLVDEIVVYDTGSSDDTVQIAAAHGARVIEGYWNDHFGDARNRALAHVRGRWTLIIDADEAVAGDHDVIRAALRAHESESGAKDALWVLVESTGGAGTDTPDVIPIARVLRTSRCRYAGRLHEQMVDAACGFEAAAETLEPLRLVHSGYLAHRMVERDKLTRNLRLAELESVEQAEVAPELILLNRARSGIAAGHHAAGAETCREILAMPTSPAVRRLTLRTLIIAETARGSGPEEMLELAATLRESSEDPFAADEVEARVRVRNGQAAEALRLICVHDAFVAQVCAAHGNGDPPMAGSDVPVEAYVDQDGHELQPLTLRETAILALCASGRTGAAVEVLLDTLRRGVVAMSAVDIHELMRAAERDLAEVAAALPDKAWKAVAVQAMQCRPPIGDALLESLWGRRPGDRVVLVAAAEVAGHLGVSRALEWSARLRAAGAAAECPLVRIAADASRPADARVLAGAVAWESFAEVAARSSALAAYAELDPVQAPSVLDQLRVIAPRLVAGAGDALRVPAPRIAPEKTLRRLSFSQVPTGR